MKLNPGITLVLFLARLFEEYGYQFSDLRVKKNTWRVRLTDKDNRFAWDLVAQDGGPRVDVTNAQMTYTIESQDSADLIQVATVKLNEDFSAVAKSVEADYPASSQEALEKGSRDDEAEARARALYEKALQSFRTLQATVPLNVKERLSTFAAEDVFTAVFIDGHGRRIPDPLHKVIADQIFEMVTTEGSAITQTSLIYQAAELVDKEEKAKAQSEKPPVEPAKPVAVPYSHEQSGVIHGVALSWDAEKKLWGVWSASALDKTDAHPIAKRILSGPQVLPYACLNVLSATDHEVYEALKQADPDSRLGEYIQAYWDNNGHVEGIESLLVAKFVQVFWAYLQADPDSYFVGSSGNASTPIALRVREHLLPEVHRMRGTRSAEVKVDDEHPVAALEVTHEEEPPPSALQRIRKVVLIEVLQQEPYRAVATLEYPATAENALVNHTAALKELLALEEPARVLLADLEYRYGIFDIVQTLWKKGTTHRLASPMLAFAVCAIAAVALKAITAREAAAEMLAENHRQNVRLLAPM